MRDEGPIVVVDAGDSLMKSLKKAKAGMSQRRAKARLIAHEWGHSGLDAAALGAVDWGLGTPFLFDLVETSSYPATAANLVCGTGQRPFPAARVFERGGRTIAVVGVTTGSVDGCLVTEPLLAAREALALVEPHKPDVTVLLWPDREERARLGVAEGDFDFVIDASGRHAKSNDPAWAGGGWVLGAGVETKSLGVLGLTFKGGKGFFPADYTPVLDRELASVEKRLASSQAMLDKGTGRPASYQRQIDAYNDQLDNLAERRSAYLAGNANQLTLMELKLDAKIADHAETLARVAEVKASFSTLSDASPSEIIARPMRAPTGSTYGGTEACISCHAPQYNQWRSTGHARAMVGLVNVDRHRDEECFSCHVTGAEPATAGGHEVIVDSVESIGGMLNVQCEACHGPSAAHAVDPSQKTVRTPSEASCKGCHTPEQDEGRFDFATYLPKIAHPNP